MLTSTTLAKQKGRAVITLETFASTSVARHVVRGVVGMALLIGSFVLAVGSVGPVALLIAPLGVLALRGCPTCWLIGLGQTIARGRAR